MTCFLNQSGIDRKWDLVCRLIRGSVRSYANKLAIACYLVMQNVTNGSNLRWSNSYLTCIAQKRETTVGDSGLF